MATQTFTLKFVLIVSITAFYLLIATKNEINYKYIVSNDVNATSTTRLETQRVYKKRIMCMILTQPKNLETKARVVNETWAKECDKYLFIARIDLNDTEVSKESNLSGLPILQPGGYKAEEYRNLTDKVFYTYKYIYSTYSDYDWYLKADDDTYVFVDNLRKFVENKNESEAITYGYDLRLPQFNFSYHSGGAGYLMSREAFSRLGKQLNKNASFCQNIGIEDVDVAHCLLNLGSKQESSLDEEGRERFHIFDVWHHMVGRFYKWLREGAVNALRKGPDCCSDTTITFHYMTSENIIKLHTLWNYYKHIRMNSEVVYFNFTSILYQMLL